MHRALWAAQGLNALCILCVAFWAAQKALKSGKKKSISAGASLPGVKWKITSTPAMVSVGTSHHWESFRFIGCRYDIGRRVERDRAGALSFAEARIYLAFDHPLPGSGPYMYCARRPMAVPA